MAPVLMVLLLDLTACADGPVDTTQETWVTNTLPTALKKEEVVLEDAKAYVEQPALVMEAGELYTGPLPQAHPHPICQRRCGHAHRDSVRALQDLQSGRSGGHYHTSCSRTVVTRKALCATIIP